VLLLPSSAPDCFFATVTTVLGPFKFPSLASLLQPRKIIGIKRRRWPPSNFGSVLIKLDNLKRWSPSRAPLHDPNQPIPLTLYTQSFILFRVCLLAPHYGATLHACHVSSFFQVAVLEFVRLHSRLAQKLLFRVLRRDLLTWNLIGRSYRRLGKPATRSTCIFLRLAGVTKCKMSRIPID